ncbi:MAG: adenylate/guanylate cyclase domain-containing protein, partial [Deltaproteobacteria bacterium]|nr:adenylate/guanylate cyclase domain-containing protein [Deltaproteobacteria bacterium]
MAEAITAVAPRSFLSGIGVRQVRLAAGLVLFSYLLSHFTNHALGNISLEAMEYGLWFHMALWRSLPATLLLYPALAIHGALGLWALYERRHFKWKATEIIQLAFGLSIPVLLCTHLIGQRVGAELYGLQKSYAQSLYLLWVLRADYFWIQITTLLVAWTHGCIGMYFWLRLRPFFPRAAPFLLAVAV